ncbi:hypothetical protein C1X65_15420 [Pseudomonas sp. FW305-70]|nr:hypothetical protein C1X65_15420 [Pseudomonas sp. FW305-70]
MTRFLDRISEQRLYLTTQCLIVRFKVIDARVSGGRSEASALLWRGSLLPLACEAGPFSMTAFHQKDSSVLFGVAAQPGGSKLPRHRQAPSPQATCRLSMAFSTFDKARP